MVRQIALAQHLGSDPLDEIAATGLENMFEVNGEEYLVLTDAEANELVRVQILESVWAFNPEYLAKYLPGGDTPNISKAISSVQKHCCEDCNALLLAAITDKDAFVADAIEADGRGHFLGNYDNAEHEVIVDGVSYFIYRTN